MLYSQLTELGIALLKALDNHLPPSIKKQLAMPLPQMVANSQRIVLRLLHYPPLEKLLKEAGNNKMPQNNQRATEHEDLTLISIVNPIIGQGLELKDLDGVWHQAPLGKLVIISGELLKICTQDFYPATTHRVLMPGNAEKNISRYSQAFFLNPRDEVDLGGGRTALSYLERHIKKRLY